MILEQSDERVFAKMQELKLEDEDAPDNYDKRYDDCLEEIQKECTLYFKALTEKAMYKANLHNISIYTVFEEMIIPELQDKLEELIHE
jgi:hypothetical protein